MTTFAFDRVGMRQRRDAYFALVRELAGQVFRPDGTYQPETENDSRIAYWSYPALVATEDASGRAFANTVLAAAPCWDEWNIFNTASIAANLMHFRDRLTPELIARSEDHLNSFVYNGDTRLPSSGANDYVFHGYNDNMPAMAIRALIYSGELLDKPSNTDLGLFRLEGLCAHFQRRGLLAENSSSTYTPITLVALADVAERSAHAEAREMAKACCDRVLLDIFGHWHQHVGGMAGSQNRAYTGDKQDWLSVLNALMWYLTGSDLCIDPVETLRHFEDFEAYSHHGCCLGFNLSQFVEVMVPAFDTISAGVQEFCASPRSYPYEIKGTTDNGPQGLHLGGVGVQTRAWHQPQYGLATRSSSLEGHCLSLRALLLRSPTPSSWRDRVGLWHQLLEGVEDQGCLVSHEGLPPAEIGHVQDRGLYRIVQQRGSALVLGSVGHSLVDKDVDRLTFSLLMNTTLHTPEELEEQGKWVFIRFGEVYLGIRMIAVVDTQRIRPQAVTRHGYLRLELPLIQGRTVHIDHPFREWCEFGYCFEIAAKDECGSFDAFQKECLATTWEYYHPGYRTSRYCGRHGELQIIDTVAADMIEFMAIDGDIEPVTKLAATDLDPALTQLFADGRRVRQRRLMYDPEFIGTPFYDTRTQTIESDLR